MAATEYDYRNIGINHKFAVRMLGKNGSEVASLDQAVTFEVKVDGDKTIKISKARSDEIFHELRREVDVMRDRNNPMFLKVMQVTVWDDAIKKLKAENLGVFPEPARPSNEPEPSDEKRNIAIGAIYASMQHGQHHEWNKEGMSKSTTIGLDIIPKFMLYDPNARDNGKSAAEVFGAPSAPRTPNPGSQGNNQPNPFDKPAARRP